MNITLPYHRSQLEARVDKGRVKAVLRLQRPEVKEAGPSQRQIVIDALARPIESPPLSALAQAARRIVILSSDHTRPVPSKIIMPLILAQIREGNPQAEIVILVTTGCHRPSTRQELIEKYGQEIVDAERIEMHICTDESAMVDKGLLPSGGRLRLNGLIDWADLLVGEGFIEPHFFAGFSGGRKSVLPGAAARQTVLFNHCAPFIEHPRTRAGILEGNPIHEDMLHAARVAGLGFIVNVALDDEKRIIGAWAGHFEKAHEAGCASVLRHARVPAVEGDIVITSNGGYPLDQNIYQAVKGMTAAEACVRPGGVIIMAAACADGHGGDFFFRQCSQDLPPEAIWQQILSVPAEETQPDQWQSQILMRVLRRAKVIFIAEPGVKDLIEKMHMTYASSLQQALELAEGFAPGGDVVVIPDGVSVVVES